MKDQEIFSGLIRLHILYHAKKEPIYGLGISSELNGFGYKLSPSTLYPILHRMEIEGYLISRKERVTGKSVRRLYQTTEKGCQALAEAKIKVEKLFGEFLKNQDC